MEKEPAAKRDRRAYWREYQRRRYAAYRASLPPKVSSLITENDPAYSLDEKIAYFTWKLQQVAQSAKKREREFNLRVVDLQLPDNCPVLGIPLDYGTPAKNFEATPSIDRIDNTKGYVTGNVLVISTRANTLKRDASRDELERASRFWLGFFAGDAATLETLGDVVPGQLSRAAKSVRHEARKEYWRNYQRKKSLERKTAK